MTSTRILLATALLAALLVATPAAAQSGEGLIAFENRYDDANARDRVELMRPDGSDRRVLVDDAASPALTPDGTTVAFERDGDIYTVDVATGEETLVTTSPMFEGSPAWSPDGSLLAFERGAPPGADCSHLSNREIVITDFSTEVQVTDSECLVEGDPDFSPDGTAIAYHTLYNRADFSGGAAIIWTQHLQTGEVTQVTGVNEGLTFYPAWSPDGDTIAYSGLYEVFTIPAAGGEATAVTTTPEDCFGSDSPDWSPTGDSLIVTLVCQDESDLAIVPAAGGQPQPVTEGVGLESNASWAGTAAPAGPGPGPGPTPEPPPGGGGSTPPQPDAPLLTLEDGFRVDGGGAADPVGQTIATSQVWDDDGAALVVLATADRFPDALAGSALAGELGPILVTPFGPDLDPRVAAEIDRVLGPDGIVAILGGTAAVSDGAAAQALQAAGISGCPAPFPTDCRYAGTGREHTATLVAQTVLAINGGSGSRALLARGDAFADAITGGAYAAEAGVPILLTPPTSLNPTTQAFITDNGISEVIVLGGTAAIDQPTMDAIPTTTRRIAGGDRTATAAAIATQLWHAEGLDGGGIVAVNVRHDNGWQAALAAAVISAVANAPQLGLETPPAPPGQPVTDAATLLGGPVEAYGSTDLISDQQLQTLQQAAG